MEVPDADQEGSGYTVSRSRPKNPRLRSRAEAGEPGMNRPCQGRRLAVTPRSRLPSTSNPGGVERDKLWDSEKGPTVFARSRDSIPVCGRSFGPRK
jgi:hypothetical protein